MFWSQLDPQESSWNVDRVLEKDEFTLAEVLNENGVIQELKAQNPNLLAYLSKPETQVELIQALIGPGIGGKDLSKAEFVAEVDLAATVAEVLSVEVSSLHSALVRNDETMGLLFAFLDQEAPLEPLIGAYVGKVLTTVFSMAHEPLIQFMRARSSVVPRFVHHIGSYFVYQFLVKMLTLGEDWDADKISEWLSEERLVQGVVDRLAERAKEADAEQVARNVAGLLSNIIDSRSPSPEDPVFADAVSDDVVRKLFATATGEKDSPTLLPLLELLEDYCGHVKDTPSLSEQGRAVPLLKHAEDHMMQLVMALKRPSTETMLTTVGKLAPPLGPRRFAVASYFRALASTDAANVIRAMIEQRVLPILADLMVAYPWNNMFHTVACDIFEHLLLLDSTDEARSAIVDEVRLHERVLEMFDQSQRLVQDGQVYQLGNLAHASQLANVLVQAASCDERVAKALAANGEWATFCAGTLAKRNALNEDHGQRSASPAWSESEPDTFESGLDAAAVDGPEDVTSLATEGVFPTDASDTGSAISESSLTSRRMEEVDEMDTSEAAADADTDVRMTESEPAANVDADEDDFNPRSSTSSDAPAAAAAADDDDDDFNPRAAAPAAPAAAAAAPAAAADDDDDDFNPRADTPAPASPGPSLNVATPRPPPEGTATAPPAGSAAAVVAAMQADAAAKPAGDWAKFDDSVQTGE